MLASQTLHTVVFINKYITLESAAKHTQPVSVTNQCLKKCFYFCVVDNEFQVLFFGAPFFCCYKCS